MTTAGARTADPGRSSLCICTLMEGLVSTLTLASRMRMMPRTVIVTAPIGSTNLSKNWSLSVEDQIELMTHTPTPAQVLGEGSANNWPKYKANGRIPNKNTEECYK